MKSKWNTPHIEDSLTRLSLEGEAIKLSKRKNHHD